MVARTIPADAPHQRRTGGSVHGSPCLLALRAALARPDGCGRRQSRSVGNGALNLAAIREAQEQPARRTNNETFALQYSMAAVPVPDLQPDLQPDLHSDLYPEYALAWAHPVVAEWFLARFGSATEPQEQGWPAILRGETTLISAPTGSGKTLAAFLVAIDQLLRLAIAGNLAPTTQVVYVSPLKALSNDVQKNLDGPLAEIQQLASARGYLCPPIRTGVRTGDTLPIERARMLRNPPHILVTTPESLYLLLTAGKSREHLRHIRTVIVDEIHAVADDKRGAHLALSLERLDALVCGVNHLSLGAFLTGRSTPPQRIGLSATQNPIELVGEFLTGHHSTRTPATIIQV